MNKQTRNILIGVVIVAVVLILGFFVWKERTPSGSVPAQVAMSLGTSTLPIASSTAPAYTIKQIPISNSTPSVPDYKSPLVCVVSVPADQCAQFQADAKTYEAQIAQNTSDPNAWVNLGTVRESAGDYSGAVVAWNYVKALYPSSPTAFDNLGDVYLNYLHQYPAAESNYLAAIKLYPGDPNPYQALFMLYTTTSYAGGANAAANILKQGIAANPKAVNLQVILARYYKSQGDTADAKSEYSAAIANAQSQGQATLAAQIQQEENSL